MTQAVERFCPVCGAERQVADSFCHRCGGPLLPVSGAESAVPAPSADRETASGGWVMPRPEDTTPRPADFFLNPTRLFAHGQPPVWGIALALVVLTGLGAGAVQAVMWAGYERVLPDLLRAFDLPQEIKAQLAESLAEATAPGSSRMAGLMLGLAYAIPRAIAGYLLVAGIFFGLGRWAGGKGSWELFTRNYALLAIPEIPSLLANLVAAALLLTRVPSVLLLLAGLLALLVATVVWAWQLWLRYVLLTGYMQVRPGRAAGIVAGWEVLKMALIALLVALIFIFGIMLAIVGQGAVGQ